MIGCKLTRISSDHRNLRTDEVIGVCKSRPEVGRAFAMVGPPLDDGYMVRVVETTLVTLIRGDRTSDDFEFATANSTYRWQTHNLEDQPCPT